MSVQPKKRGVMDIAFRCIEIMIAVFLALMVTFTFLNVVLRYLFDTGLAWSEEISRLCFIYLVYFGSIVAARDNAHLMVDSLIAHVPKKAQKVIYIVIQGISILILAMLVSGSWQWAMMKRNDVWPITQFPVFLINISGAVLGIAYIAICIVNILRLLIHKEDPMLLLMPRKEESTLMDTADAQKEEE